jgi:methionyl-tRNA formyltransferase
LQPTNLKEESLEELKSLNANLQIVVAFRMPKVVWEMPELGTFNLHASLLPNYRGAAPINWAIINGETKPESPLFIDDKIDTGAMILSSEIDSNKCRTPTRPFNASGQRDRYKYFRAHRKEM